MTASAQLTDGIYALFHTPLGSITAELYYAEAPATVANFMGLATGEKTWLEEESGLPANRPYYDGIRVNRVVSNFVVQTGSQNGSNSGGGPGYTFPDEFNPALRHNTSGVVSMANSGPNSNGSQFFFTLAATPWLDDVHNVFGQVISGYDVLDAIEALPQSNSLPIPDVVFNHVEIVRVGTNAQNFDIAAYDLPVVSNAIVHLSRTTNDSINIPYNQTSNTFYQLSYSTNLASWDILWTGWDRRDSSPANPLTLLDPGPAGYISMAVATYPHLWIPTDVTGTIFQDPNADLRIDIGSSTVSSTNSQSGVITGGNWSWGAYHGELIIFTSGTTPARMDFEFTFTNNTSGTYTAIYYGSAQENVSGSFSYTPTPP